MTKQQLEKASHQGELIIGNLILDCYVLEDGRRVLSQRGISKSLGKSKTGGTNLAKFLSDKRDELFIPEDLIAITNSPILFIPPHGGNPAFGYSATILVDICDAVLTARKNGTLTRRNMKLADNCEILTRAFARVGITALIDEATGYIRDKKKNEYIELFKQFVADEAREWQKEFPEPFFNMIYKIYGKDRLSTKNHPQYFGKFISKYVYYPLAGSNGAILEMLKEKNPKLATKNGTKVRKHKLHSLLQNIGVDALRQHVWRLVGIGEASETKTEFERKFNKVFPPKNQQLDWLDE